MQLSVGHLFEWRGQILSGRYSFVQDNLFHFNFCYPPRPDTFLLFVVHQYNFSPVIFWKDYTEVCLLKEDKIFMILRFCPRFWNSYVSSPFLIAESRIRCGIVENLLDSDLAFNLNLKFTLHDQVMTVDSL